MVFTIVELILTGFHEPVIPFAEVVGKTGAVVFWQTELAIVKSGVVCGRIVIEIVKALVHCPGAGVKV